MSFAMTTAQMRNRTKTVTRRAGWRFLKPGDKVMACVKCQGLKKGEKIERIHPIEIVSVRRERLWDIERDDVAREGYPGRSRLWFMQHYCSQFGPSRLWALIRESDREFGTPSVLEHPGLPEWHRIAVTRIRFEHQEPLP